MNPRLGSYLLPLALSNKFADEQTARTCPTRAVLFDALGTLFDVYSVALLAEQLSPVRRTAQRAVARQSDRIHRLT